jgi:hypothetical protein
LKIDVKKYVNFCLWIKQNTGRKFAIKETTQSEYINARGEREKLQRAPFLCFDTFLLYSGQYLKDYQSEEGDTPQIELKNDFTQIKIYLNDNKIWTQ